MFVARESELAKLNKRYKSDNLEFIVMYGRRRVGKTSLINEFVKDKPTIYCSAINATARDNLQILSKAIFLFENPDSIDYPIFASYDAAFNEITRIAQKKRIVFVIDELPYLAKAEESLTSRLQHLLDYQWKNTKLFFIVCGSSMSFMEKEVLSEKSPLFGRRTAQFEIKPLDYYDSKKMLPKSSLEESALIYGITGGVPHYINKLDFKNDLKDALLENFFDTSSYLFEEPGNLLKQELREPAIYNSIISSIASGATKLNEIANKLNIESSTCIKYINPLIELGILKKEEPIINKHSRRVIYKVSDNFFRFWYRFVPENLSIIAANKMDLIYDKAVGSYLSEYMGLVFEDMCKQYLLRNMDTLPFVFNKIGKWWGNDAILKKEIELDIVAIGSKESNVAGNNYLIGSCKYTNNKIDVDELNLIKSYGKSFINENDNCYYYIFSKSGFTNELFELEKEEKVKLISLKDMYL